MIPTEQALSRGWVHYDDSVGGFWVDPSFAGDANVRVDRRRGGTWRWLDVASAGWRIGDAAGLVWHDATSDADALRLALAAWPAGGGE